MVINPFNYIFAELSTLIQPFTLLDDKKGKKFHKSKKNFFKNNT